MSQLYEIEGLPCRLRGPSLVLRPIILRTIGQLVRCDLTSNGQVIITSSPLCPYPLSHVVDV